MTVLVAMAGLLGLVFVFVQLPSGSRFWTAVQNSGHCLAFATFTAIALFLLGGSGTRLSLRGVAAVAAGLFVLGLVIEVGQSATGRGASLYDIVMNTIGIASGTSLFGCVAVLGTERGGADARRPFVARVRAWILGFVTVSLSVWCVREPVYILLAEAFAPSLPVLADFENFGAARNVVARHSTVRIERTPPRWASNPSRVLAVEFEPGRRSTVGFLDVDTDWTGYRLLRFDVYSTEKAAFELSVRLDLLGSDDRGHRKRLYRRVRVEAGENGIRIDLDELLRRHDEARIGDEAHELKVKSVYLFVSSSDRRRSILVDDLRVE